MGPLDESNVDEGIDKSLRRCLAESGCKSNGCQGHEEETVGQWYERTRCLTERANGSR